MSETQPAARPVRWGWSRSTLLGVGILVAILLVARLCAPYAMKSLINRRLAHIPGYTGHVESINLNLWRGAYGIFGMKIVKSSGRVTEPFFSADSIDFSLAWRELFRGKFVSQIYIKNGHLNFLRGPDEDSSQLTADQRWQNVINDLFPIDITLLDIKGGVLRFVDTTQNPRVDVAIHDLNVRATGLRNRPGPEHDPLPAKLNVSGVIFGEGQLRLFAKAEPLADQPHFDLNLEMKKVSLPSLNNFLHAYANVTVTEGQFEMFFQMEMRDGHYEGYAKPFLSDLKIEEPPDKQATLSDRIWQKLVAVAAQIAKNKDTKQIATRIPFSGDSKKMDVHTWKTIENGLHHGFVKALSQGFEGNPNPDGVTPASHPSK
jgi:hypothetical protein